MVEDRLKIAVFIDFDNIEIGVKSTLNRHFDIGAVLEAIKERGEVVTKIAYGDWKRAGEHSRSMTQHAIQMVQRNLTPGGDKNGADINLALDALEMAFTRNHINAFVIVGGDSDFIALVEKLKQYDKKVLVVGGRNFTSAILQKNCHEFIAYENLIAPQRRPAEKARTAIADSSGLSKAFPMVRRALKVLTEREVSPQLGLLKSTLLQLDSTFSERDYGAGTFRDFIEKMAAAGYVNLKQVDRSLLVELKEQFQSESTQVEAEPIAAPPPPNGQSGEPVVSPPPPPTPMQAEEGMRAMQEAFQNSKVTPHWPMYLRNVKQFIKNASPTFDEQRYGFHSFLEAVRSAQRAGLFRLERNRQGILRVFPGNQMPQMHRPGGSRVAEPPAVEQPVKPYDVEDDISLQRVEPEPVFAPAPEDTVVEAQPEPEAPVVESAPATEEVQAETAVRKRRASHGIKRKTVAPRKSASTGTKRPRKKTSQPPDEGSLPL
jgi:uncharacterized LabA/DUF88 family protein